MVAAGQAATHTGTRHSGKGSRPDWEAQAARDPRDRVSPPRKSQLPSPRPMPCIWAGTAVAVCVVSPVDVSSLPVSLESAPPYERESSRQWKLPLLPLLRRRAATRLDSFWWRRKTSGERLGGTCVELTDCFGDRKLNRSFQRPEQRGEITALVRRHGDGAALLNSSADGQPHRILSDARIPSICGSTRQYCREMDQALFRGCRKTRLTRYYLPYI